MAQVHRAAAWLSLLCRSCRHRCRQQRPPPLLSRRCACAVRCCGLTPRRMSACDGGRLQAGGEGRAADHPASVPHPSPPRSPARHKFFNTNNLWVNLKTLKAALDACGEAALHRLGVAEREAWAGAPRGTPAVRPARPPGGAATGTQRCAAMRCQSVGLPTRACHACPRPQAARCACRSSRTRRRSTHGTRPRRRCSSWWVVPVVRAFFSYG